ncbi:MAG TPA: EscU/YscU/HrcU family type III secretion system export apparatus switch protein [Rubrivivax sp.]|nr:EscU/YscU/HrcU family type III secretion system export apparatus switch protein [Rubrivivax sp.]HRY86903.1 EscU/YscU/HrcU family type III secretion system export apparatus switch protein [Rubrivivax sp.]HRZ62570.1 EscU/YscU/HrcU family type III secretion system export apparatus switch protein [Rubrivivax sp.]
MADTQDRRLPASERKLRKARAQGQIARSRDLAHFAAVGTVLGLLIAFAPRLLQALQQSLAAGLRFDAAALADPLAMPGRLAQGLAAAFGVVLVLGAVMLPAALAAGVAAGGWNFSWQALAPKPEKLDPFAGIGRLVSGRQVGEALKACTLALIVGVVGALFLRARLDDFAATLGLPLPLALGRLGQALADGLLWLLLALAAFAALDVPLQRYLHAKRLRMSTQEYKQEQRETEGSPELKQRQRARMRELATRRMLAAVPKADLVVMNPTHYAVALRYDESRMSAPTVVAKGADLVALRIRDTAQGARVPVLQAPPLARALYAHAELDRPVPQALFTAIAQVLAHVYALRAHLAGQGAAPAPLAAVAVPPGLDPQEGSGEAGA